MREESKDGCGSRHICKGFQKVEELSISWCLDKNQGTENKNSPLRNLTRNRKNKFQVVWRVLFRSENIYL